MPSDSPSIPRSSSNREGGVPPVDREGVPPADRGKDTPPESREGAPPESRGVPIHLENVSKRYPRSVALDGITLTVEPGEFMTLLGPSGSGKTTTLNLIAGFTSLSGGSITIDGKRIDRVPAHQRGLGVVFQHYALFPHLTVADNVAFPLKRRGVPRDQQKIRVNSALETAGLGALGERYPAELSGGQQQRVVLARALVFEPTALLLDEPLGALDKNLREKLQLELRRIHREVGRTFVFVTHDQEEALTLSDRIAVFNEGHIEQVGTAQELYERPSSLFVAGFIGESAMIRTPGSSRVTVLRPERGTLLTRESEVAAGHRSVPVTVLQSIYLGSGWKYECVLPDGSTGVVRDGAEPRWRGSPGTSALLAWNPADAVELPER
ncbi:ABC transporter ATP-binding protein [Lysinibacter sp. HNR]|uniref:ABC transporter ATP-binding protein n=1 Tax=Lysinibacter sp. HNR TaxID=3031408 RepID=UPI002435E49E|nr:ABC transporter ATP-binding protein [Lysinibacter sp. HNR]WGD37023.1 ABC transporter ATP-binding protein [Lysinibacter sp. HNR]